MPKSKRRKSPAKAAVQYILVGLYPDQLRKIDRILKSAPKRSRAAVIRDLIDCAPNP